LYKQFGGAGDDIQAREERHEADIPTKAGERPIYKGVHMETSF